MMAMQSESFEDTFTGCWAPTIKEEATTIKAEPADIYTSDDVSGAEQAKASMPSSGMDTNTVENRTIAAQASWTSQQHVSDEPMDGAGMFEIKREYSDNSLESHYHSPCNEEASATKPSQANLMMHPPVTEYPADAASGLHLKTEDPGLQECIHASYGCHETNSSMTAIQENRSSPLEQSSWTPQPSESAVDSTICPNIKTKDSVLPENLPQSNEYQHALCDGEIPATQPSYEQDSSQQPVKMETSEEMMYNDEHEESDSIDQSEESMLMTAQYGCSVAMLTDPSSAGPSSAQIGIATLHAARPQTPTSLSCPTCNQIFSCKDSLRSHEEIHSVMHCFICNICSKTFTKKCYLQKHIKRHSRTGQRFPCTTCNEAFDTSFHLKEHEATTHNKACALTPDDQNVAENADTSIVERPFQCDLCPLRFKTKNTLHSHREVHATIKPYACSKCGKDFIRQRGLKDHEQTHNSDGVFRCEKCPETFRNFTQLRLHRRKHSKLPQDAVQQNVPVTLVNSDMQVPGDQNAAENTDTLVPERPFECDLCPLRFKTKNTLHSHREVHATIKPYTCSKCGKAFIRQRGLKDHEQTHNPDGVFRCEKCPETFPNFNQLRFHRRMHSKLPQDAVQQNVPETLVNSDMQVPGDQNVPVNLVNSDMHVQVSETTEVVGQKQTCLNNNEALPANILSHAEAVPDMNVSSTLATNLGSAPFPCYYYPVTIMYPQVPSVIAVQNPLGMPFVCFPHNQSYGSSSILPEQISNNLIGNSLIGNSHSCDLCGCTFSDIEELNTHQKTHVQSAENLGNIDTSSPETTEFVGQTQNSANYKYELRERKLPHTCTEPALDSNSESTPEEKALEIEKLGYSQSCHLCGCTFSDIEKLSAHQKTHIQSAVPYTATDHAHQEVCTSRHDLVDEQLQVHTLDKSSQYSVLRDEVHSDLIPERPFQCELCPLRFKKKDTLKSHQDVHTGVKPYVCGTCGRAFARRSALHDHQQSHNPDGVFKCNRCPETFSCFRQLRVHQRLHPKLLRNPVHQNVAENLGNSDTSSKFEGQTQNSTDNKDELSEHKLLHTEAALTLEEHLLDIYQFACFFCSRICTQPSVLNRHIAQAHSSLESPFLCYVCNQSYNTTTSLREHVNYHRRGNSFKSYDCAISDDKLKTHEKTNNQSAIPSAACENVQNVSTNSSELHLDQQLLTNTLDTSPMHPVVLIKNHEATPSTAGKSGQNVCAKSFELDEQLPSPATLDKLLMESMKLMENSDEIHNQSAILSAASKHSHNVCIRSSESVDEHLRKVTFDKQFMDSVNRNVDQPDVPDERPFQCSLCPLRFKRKGNLRTHQEVHAAVKPYVCSTCGKAFIRQRSLRGHEQIHDQNRVYKCNRCSETFSRSRDLKIHRKIHSRPQNDGCQESVAEEPVNKDTQSTERPHQCHLCPLRFKRKGTLRSHQEVHATVKPYVCHKCGKTFTRKRSLQDHEQIHKDGLFKCEKCPETFSRFHHLKIHRRMHSRPQQDGCQETVVAEKPVNKETQSAERPYQCQLCPLRFKTKGTLSSHQEVHATVKPYVCNTCGKAFVRRSTLQDHEQTHNPDRVFKCKKCSETFSSSKDFKQHRKMHPKPSKVKTFRCDTCEKDFPTQRALVRHGYEHTQVKPFQCTQCSKGFLYEKSLQVHQKTHSEVRTYKCLLCKDRAFYTRVVLDAHMNYYHSESHDLRLFACNLCDKRYPSASSLAYHVLVHKNLKPFACHTCGKSYRSKMALKYHKKYHTGEKPSFFCDICKKGFLALFFLNRHKRESHSHRDRSFLCQYCDKTFTHSGRLSRHVAIHTRKNVLACKICGKTCLRKDNLRTHMKVHRPGRRKKTTHSDSD
ncbi:zinc finger protein 91-like isoform X3 [Patiria miniata]|uniref:C2H2-type domain-containing protein n=1 Tax=Patiria miniata TaxID=46514 RepID=A0A914A6X2_PATMI|nr:zinc finger protein 91-like isoform X3 [Patiria miniata]